MTQANTLLPSPTMRSDRDRARPLVSLIEVPEIKGSRKPRAHARAHSRVDGRRDSRRPVSPRRRRRLRREIRIMGCALLVMAPLLSACTLAWSTGPVRVLACSINETTARSRDGIVLATEVGPAQGSEMLAVGSQDTVVLSTDAEAMPPGTENVVPVIFPGYVLPDDSHEGPVHEGS